MQNIRTPTITPSTSRPLIHLRPLFVSLCGKTVLVQTVLSRDKVLIHQAQSIPTYTTRNVTCPPSRACRPRARPLPALQRVARPARRPRRSLHEQILSCVIFFHADRTPTAV